MSRLAAVVKEGIRDLFPGYFALVMATGIVSIACHLLGFEWVAQALFLVNKIAYGILWALFLLRLVLFRRQFLLDLTDHARGPGFFTLVVGTCMAARSAVPRIVGDVLLASVREVSVAIHVAS